MNKQKFYELSTPQKNIWNTEQYYVGTSINNICGVVYIKEAVNFELLENSIRVTMNSHDNFKEEFVTKDSVVYQTFNKNLDSVFIDTVDLKTESELSKLEKEIARTPFSIAQNDLFSFKIFRYPNDFGGIILSMHHLLGDSWTLGLICQEIILNYKKLLNDNSSNDTIYSYVDFITKEKEYIDSESFEKDKAYWNDLFKTVPEVASIPSLSRSSSKSSCVAGRKCFNLSKDLIAKVNDFCELNKVSIYNFLMSIFSIYIGRVSNLDDFVIGTPILNRLNFAEKLTNGMFVSTVPLRINIQNDASFVSFSQSIAQSSISMFRHQRYPYSNILSDLRKKDSNIPNLYNIILSYQITKTLDDEIPCETHWVFNGNCADDLQIHIVDYNNTGSLNILYDYKKSKYTATEITNLHARIYHMIEQVINNTNISVNDIEIVTENEKHQLLYEFNNTKVDYPKDKTIVDLFEEQVEKTPDNIAVVFEDQKLTYRELNERANQLARYLIKKGVKSNDIIGICLNRSIEVFIAIIGVLKSGAAYLPIDINYPQDRIAYMLSDSNCKMLISYLGVINFDGEIIEISSKNFDNISSANVNFVISQDATSYVIYTSGSTGKPKGVLLKHSSLYNLANYCNHYISYLADGTYKSIVSVTTISFDIFIFETLISLQRGLKVVLANPDEQVIPRLLNDLIVKENIQIIQTTPSRMQLLVNNIADIPYLSNLKFITLAGEQLPLRLVKKLKSLIDCTIYNGYGPSETTVFATLTDVTNQNPITIGHAISNNNIYVLDSHLHFLPIGVIGELYISGDNVGKGYINRPDLTRSLFINDLYCHGNKMYKSGDIGYYDVNGNIICLGRIDHQVKIRGQRIELDEIENTLSEYSSIKNCVILKKVLHKNDEVLCAFYTSDNIDIELDSLRAFLKSKLPIYMVPQYFIHLDSLPYTPNGKIDKLKLDCIDLSNYIKIDKIVKPKNDFEDCLLKLVEKILNVNNISMSSSFLEIGGDSLSAINLSMSIYSTLGVEISVKDILDASSLISISDLILSNNKNTTNFNATPVIMDLYPLSSAQKRIYLASKVAGEKSLIYNISGAVMIDTMLDNVKVEKIFKKIISLQSSFRTVFVIDNENIKQRILNLVEFKVHVFNAHEKDIKKIVNSFAMPFDLSNAPLLRVSLCYIDNNKTLLLIDSHHIIMDGTSMHLLINEFCKLYNDESLAELPIQYKDYSVWENNFINSDKINIYKDYWVNKFKNSDLPELKLPYDFTMTKEGYKGKILSKCIPTTIANNILDCSKELKISPYIYYLSAFIILLYKYSGQNEIIIGTPFANRMNESLKDIIGMFVNNLTVDAKIDSSLPFKDFLMSIKEQSLSDIENGIYPYDLLLKDLNLSGKQLFNVLFTYQNTEKNNIKINGLDGKILSANLNVAKFNLSFELNPNNNLLNIEYRSDLFSKITIDGFYSHYIAILNYVLNNPDTSIDNIKIISEEEENKILYKFNNNTLAYPDCSLVDLFNDIVKQNKNQIAVISGEKSITYDELDKKSNYIANKIKYYGIQPHQVVGVCLPRSIELLISIWGILKSGCAYMPMYVDYPSDRLEYMLTNSNSNLLITNSELSAKINYLGNKEIINNFNTIPDVDTLDNISIFPLDPAYIIYTSGSTGKPKGVMICHKNLMNFLFNFKHFYDNINSSDTFLASTNISFDVSVWELFLPILSGAKLVLYSEEIIRDLIKYCNTIVNYNITGLYIPPNILNEVYSILSTYRNININKMLVGVEPIRKSTLNQYLALNPKMKIVNGYGPTETTICCSCLNYKHDESDDGIVSIGHALYNNNIYILNDSKQLQPIGIPGELYVSGDGVGLGYINNPTENAKNYIKNIFDNKSTNIYRTGDFVKWLPDGNIQFIGRNDSQVKISGHRIELSEINLMVMKYPSINKAFTTIYNKNSNNYIVVYYTSNKNITNSDLISFLRKKLADYMIPNFFVKLAEFPLTANGKIDKKNLPVPIISIKEKYVAPRNGFEKSLSNIWKKLLNSKKVGIDDNFFEIGGDSLLAIKFELEAMKLGLNISYADIFSYPTIRKLSDKNTNDNTFTFNYNYDYSSIDKLISTNKTEELDNIIIAPSKNTESMLLIGATGFLGSQILNEYLDLNPNNIVYCLIRSKSLLEPEERLKENLNFYFGNKYNSAFGKRIIVVRGDITNPSFSLSAEQLSKLASKVSIVVHAAALVKHYGSYEHFKDINIIGTKNVVDFASKYNKKLYYISTLSVSGDIENSDGKQVQFYEKDFYINQSLNNVYIYTKFEAEKIVFEAIQSGLQACILRIGNISNRYSDAKFQINVSENAFVNRLKSFIALGEIPQKLLKHYIEFTPVDSCAKAIITIIQNDYNFTVFHLFDQNFISCEKLANIIEKCNIHIVPVSDDQFKSDISNFLNNDKLKNKISGLVTDLDSNKAINLIASTIPNSDFSQKYLKLFGFDWPIIDDNYIIKYINYFLGIKYF